MIKSITYIISFLLIFSALNVENYPKTQQSYATNYEKYAKVDFNKAKYNFYTSYHVIKNQISKYVKQFFCFAPLIYKLSYSTSLKRLQRVQKELFFNIKPSFLFHFNWIKSTENQLDNYSC